MGVDIDADDTVDLAYDEADETGVNISPPAAEGIAEKRDSDQLSRSLAASCNDNRGGNAVDRIR